MNKATTAGPIEEIVTFFAKGPSQEEIAAFQLSGAAQEHIRKLLTKNSAGTLTREENRELDKLTVLNDVVSLIRVRARAANPQPLASASAQPGA